ncbi:nucleolar and coiled-body phosphoprotein 1 [Vigna unguiculata]|uniref:DnaJ-like protein subfamily C member 8 n=1 Tax=Vigna unguiculata TaxID=3917 RepID=A0A4D6N2K3_VIGUN|nr:nucleolar and coiled-body phosphoprotein 1 [Vigna unguiculata]QCE07996.1 DnaJ-like protein subfamily C member 8 [Vigna unguiculata]
MGDRRKKQRRLQDSSTSSSSSSSSDSDRSSRRRRRRREKERRRRSGEKEERRRKRRDRERRKRKRLRDSDDSSNSSEDEDEQPRVLPETMVAEMMREFPNVGNDLKQLLQMIDNGQAVDIKGISERSLAKHLKKLFLSLNLKENGDRVFLLPSKGRPTLDVLGPLINSYTNPINEHAEASAPVPESSSVPVDVGNEKMVDDHVLASPDDHSVGPRKRMIGPAMPSAELLAAAAKLTEAQTELREAELDDDSELFIGPPPPAMVTEAESANEAERFEEVTRIMEVEADSPYDVLGVNHNMSDANVKKRYWKISLLVHPDKCSHPQAHQAFIKLNKAFKELQDPEKRKAMDEKIKLKQEQEELKAELKTMREAALWRRSQGISMEGDEELLAQTEVKVEPKRDEWMTTLPPERKPGGVTMQSTKFSRGPKEGRGDTSAWTDTPLDRAQKAKMNYLEAYNEATALASNDEEKKRASEDADLVDKYNKAKRSKTLVQKHQEEVANKSKKKSKQVKQQPGKQEWVGQHPWKPWDREKDLTAGRKSVNFDSESMTKDLSSRFSSGNFQRNFL